MARYRQMHKIVAALVQQARRKLGRKSRPTAAIIDSQSAPSTHAGGPSGYDPGKRVYGRKRHIITDTDGLLLAVHVHPANVQDVHGAVPLLKCLRQHFPKLRRVFADRVYRGPQLVNALSGCGPWTIEIVERPLGVKGFQLLPRRWVVERTFAWFGRCRRLAKDFEGSAATEVAWLLVAHLRLLTRRLARKSTN
jgi:transposase